MIPGITITGAVTNLVVSRDRKLIIFVALSSGVATGPADPASGEGGGKNLRLR